jgi:hypothetical protein
VREIATPREIALAARSLAKPCSRWEAEEVLDLSVLILHSLKWPVPDNDLPEEFSAKLYLKAASGLMDS